MGCGSSKPEDTTRAPSKKPEDKSPLIDKQSTAPSHRQPKPKKQQPPRQASRAPPPSSSTAPATRQNNIPTRPTREECAPPQQRSPPLRDSTGTRSSPPNEQRQHRPREPGSVGGAQRVQPVPPPRRKPDLPAPAPKPTPPQTTTTTGPPRRSSRPDPPAPRPAGEEPPAAAASAASAAVGSSSSSHKSAAVGAMEAAAEARRGRALTRRRGTEEKGGDATAARDSGTSAAAAASTAPAETTGVGDSLNRRGSSPVAVVAAIREALTEEAEVGAADARERRRQLQLELEEEEELALRREAEEIVRNAAEEWERSQRDAGEGEETGAVVRRGAGEFDDSGAEGAERSEEAEERTREGKETRRGETPNGRSSSNDGGLGTCAESVGGDLSAPDASPDTRPDNDDGTTSDDQKSGGSSNLCCRGASPENDDFSRSDDQSDHSSNLSSSSSLGSNDDDDGHHATMPPSASSNRPKISLRGRSPPRSWRTNHKWKSPPPSSVVRRRTLSNSSSRSVGSCPADLLGGRGGGDAKDRTGPRPRSYSPLREDERDGMSEVASHSSSRSGRGRRIDCEEERSSVSSSAAEASKCSYDEASRSSATSASLFSAEVSKRSDFVARLNDDVSQSSSEWQSSQKVMSVGSSHRSVAGSGASSATWVTSNTEGGSLLLRAAAASAVINDSDDEPSSEEGGSAEESQGAGKVGALDRYLAEPLSNGKDVVNPRETGSKSEAGGADLRPSPKSVAEAIHKKNEAEKPKSIMVRRQSQTSVVSDMADSAATSFRGGQSVASARSMGTANVSWADLVSSDGRRMKSSTAHRRLDGRAQKPRQVGLQISNRSLGSLPKVIQESETSQMSLLSDMVGSMAPGWKAEQERGEGEEDRPDIAERTPDVWNSLRMVLDQHQVEVTKDAWKSAKDGQSRAASKVARQAASVGGTSASSYSIQSDLLEEIDAAVVEEYTQKHDTESLCPVRHGSADREQMLSREESRSKEMSRNETRTGLSAQKRGHGASVTSSEKGVREGRPAQITVRHRPKPKVVVVRDSSASSTGMSQASLASDLADSTATDWKDQQSIVARKRAQKKSSPSSRVRSKPAGKERIRSKAEGKEKRRGGFQSEMKLQEQ